MIFLLLVQERDQTMEIFKPLRFDAKIYPRRMAFFAILVEVENLLSATK
jgi:hypothetical protein